MDPEEHHYYYYNELQEHKSGNDRFVNVRSLSPAVVGHRHSHRRKGKKGAKKPYILGRHEDLEPDIWQMRYGRISGYRCVFLSIAFRLSKLTQPNLRSFKKENARLEYHNIKKPWESSYTGPQG